MKLSVVSLPIPKNETSAASRFATVPLDDGDWEPLPMMQLLAYRGGKLIFEGTRHTHEYHKPDRILDTQTWPGL